MASIRDVAKKAEVGVGTVSRALNGTGYVSDATRKKIERAAEEIGYTPNELARNLFRNKTGIIGVIIPDLDHPFFSCLAKYIEVELYKQGYKTMICNTIGISDREQEYLDMLNRNIVDGIITAAHSLEGEAYLSQSKPIVSIDRDFGPKIPLIGSDHVKGGEIAAQLLIDVGCKKVMQISGVSPFVAATNRHTAFTKKMQENHVEVVEMVMDWNDFSWNAHYELVGRFLRENPGIDGVFGGDLGAVAAMHISLAEGKRIPQDIKFVGFDGMDITRMVHPTLTAICQNVQLLSEIAVNTLLDLVEDRKRVPYRQVLDVELQRGGTVFLPNPCEK